MPKVLYVVCHGEAQTKACRQKVEVHVSPTSERGGSVPSIYVNIK